MCICRSVAVWDPSHHLEPPNSSGCGEQVIDNVTIEVPSYVSDIGNGHDSKVVAIRSFQDEVDKSFDEKTGNKEVYINSYH